MNGNTLSIILYVDDLLIAGKEEGINHTVKSMQKECKIKNLGEFNYYLEISIQRMKEGSDALDHENKANEIIEKFNLNYWKPCQILMDPGILNLEDEENSLLQNTQYR